MLESGSIDLVDIQKIRRCKHLRLHYNPIKGRFKLTAPWYISQKKCLSFVTDSKLWMDDQLKNSASSMSEQKTFSLWGKSYHLLIKNDLRDKVFIDGESIVIACRDVAKAPGHLKVFIRSIANKQLGIWCDELCQKIGKSCPKITLRDTKSRWGSCSVRGINFSWRLSMLPKSVAFYVCAHEVAHIIHPNHSKEFWKLVSELCEEYQGLKDDLHILGRSVMRYNFK